MPKLKFKIGKLSKANDRGFIALTMVLIISAITLMIGISASLISISEADMGIQRNQSSQAYYLANLCLEQALMRLKENSDYPGNETINLENGSCTILPIEGSWIIKVLAVSSNQVKKMRIKISQISPEMVIDSWQEVAEF